MPWKLKTVKKKVPFCTICNQEVHGNGSAIMPYTCKCGVWTFDHDKFAYVNPNETYTANQDRTDDVSKVQG